MCGFSPHLVLCSGKISFTYKFNKFWKEIGLKLQARKYFIFQGLPLVTLFLLLLFCLSLNYSLRGRFLIFFEVHYYCLQIGVDRIKNKIASGSPVFYINYFLLYMHVLYYIWEYYAGPVKKSPASTKQQNPLFRCDKEAKCSLFYILKENIYLAPRLLGSPNETYKTFLP